MYNVLLGSVKDLMSLVAICKVYLDSLGIPYGKVSNWTVNTRAKCRLEQCRKNVEGLLDINIVVPVMMIGESELPNTKLLEMERMLYCVSRC